MPKLVSSFALGLSLLAIAGVADAKSFVVVKDVDGKVADPDGPNITSMRNKLLDEYEASGFALPEVLTVWTTFPMNGNNFGTYIDPRANDVSGIGFEDVFPPTGIKEAAQPPLRAILWHNNVFAMDQRAALHRSDASAGDYARYLFLLELSHLWGPDISLPEPGADDAIGFPFHWSFFLDVGGGPAGGNPWTDNGDGTFTVVQGNPGTVKFSMLDLYLMGLATSDEVEPFHVLLPTEVPTTPTDPFWGGAYSGQSFPWFDVENEPLTVTATTRELTVDDVIAANGARDPVAGAQDTFTVGIVLMVPADATDEEIEAASEDFAPFADALAGHFDDATSGRGTLDVVTFSEDPGEGGGGAGAGGAPPAGGSDASGGNGGSAATDGDDGGCDCNVAGSVHSAGGVGVLAMLAALSLRRRRRAAS